MKGCCCTFAEGAKTITLCDMHARELTRRVSEMPIAIKAWNDALDAAEAKLVARNVTGNPIDEWIAETLGGLRKRS